LIGRSDRIKLIAALMASEASRRTLIREHMEADDEAEDDEGECDGRTVPGDWTMTEGPEVK
jgi:hypothetical protein